MSNKTIAVNPSLYEYILGVSLREPAVLRKLREETAAMPEHNMQISPEQGQFMALLVRLMGAHRCLEIGTFTGYSALAVALAIDDDGTVLTLDTSEEYTDVARRYWKEAGVDQKIELRLAPALETLEEMLDADDQRHTYDFVFIDADKTNYNRYYEACLQLVRDGGCIAFDNTLWDGKVADQSVKDADTAALRELNEKLYADERIELSLLPIADGLTLCRKI
ncbi:MAG: class I SAM-dependent methyltransferase [Gammaproteobacteria bacterium]